MKQMPKIEKLMTELPYTIGKTLPLSKALDMMRTHGIRHLPVQSEGKLVGLITDRDLKLATSFAHADQLTVEDAMTPDPHCVTPQTPLDEVAEIMAEHKYGCVIVQQENGKIVGIFTATDALRFLSEKTRELFKHAG